MTPLSSYVPVVGNSHKEKGFNGRIVGKEASVAVISIATQANKEPCIIEQNSKDDLYRNFRAFLIFGRFIGLLPIEGLFQSDYQNLKYRKFSIPSIVSIVITLSLSVNMFVGIIHAKQKEASDADDLGWIMAMFMFYAAGTFFFAYFYWRCSDLVEIIRKWNSLQIYFTKPDTTLRRDINVLGAIATTSCVLENLFGNMKNFPVDPESEAYKQQERNPDMSPWEIFYHRSFGQWAEIVPYNLYLTVFLFGANKLALYGWNYADLFIAFMGRALYFKFKALCRQGESILLGEKQCDHQKWSHLVRDHGALCDMLRDINRFLSPLIFVSFGTNVFFICMQFHNRLNPYENTNAIASIYAWWAVFQLLGRLYLVWLMGARTNEWAHQVGDLLRNCPNGAYTLEVQRTESFVRGRGIAFSGMGCFSITKPLILRIVGVVFTFEMVLLQSLQTSLRKP